MCNEKEYLSPCAHCDKKVCPDCKSAHIDVLKRELTRINAQVRRGLHRLSDIHSAAEKNAGTVQQNCIAVREEVENIGQRLIKAIRDRTDYLKSEVDSHMAMEVRNLNQLKDNLETEIANIESNSELAERHMNDNTEWDDAELVDAKDIFLKTVEFIRNFEHDTPAGGDFRRPIRFTAAQDPHSLSKTLECFGELNINKQPAITDGSQQYGGGVAGGFPALMAPGSSAPGLMRSKSDHRLVSALRQQEERGGYGAYGDESGRSSPVARRRFGERPPRKDSDAGLYGADDSAYDSPCERRHKYRSRFTRRNLDPDDDLESYRPEPHAPPEAPKEKKKERERVLDTDDATKGPLSGIARICDVPRVIQKVVESERVPKKKKEEPKKEPAAVPTPAPAAPTPAPVPWRRQKSEDDEIAKIKKMNKEADARCTQGGTAAAATASAAETPASTPAPPRAPSQPKGPESRRTSQTTAPPPTPPASAAARPRPPREETAEERRANRQMASADAISAWVNEPFETPGSVPVRRKEPTPATPPAPPESTPRTPLRTAPASSQPRSGSTSSESSEAASRTPTTSAPAKTSTTPVSSATPSTPPAGSNAATAVTSSATPATPSTPAAPATPTTPSRPPFKSRFLGRAPTPKQDSTQDDESSSSEETDSESETESSSEESSEEEDSAPPARRPSIANSPAAAAVKTSLGPLLARSAHARGSDDATTTSVTSRQPRSATGYGSQRGTDDYSPGATATSSASTYGNRYGTSDTTATEPKPYESRFNSRYGDLGAGNGLARSRTSSALDARPAPAAEDTYAAYAAKFSRPRATYNDEYATPSSATTTSPRYSTTTPSYSSRFLNRSKSSAALDASEDASRSIAGDEATSGPASAVAGGGRTDGTSRYAPSIGERRSWLARSGSSEQTDERGSSGGGGSSPSASVRSSVQRQASGDSGATSGEQGEAAATAAGSRSEALSSWAQYLKNKYGYRNSKDGGTSTSIGKVGEFVRSLLLCLTLHKPFLQAVETLCFVSLPLFVSFCCCFFDGSEKWPVT